MIATTESAKTVFILTENPKAMAPFSEVLQGDGLKINYGSQKDFTGDMIADGNYAMVIMDILVPPLDGITLCHEIRTRFHGPIVIMAACKEEMFQILGLELGADDFLCKPVSPALFIARVRALLRRKKLAEHREDSAIVQGNLAIDAGRREVKLEGKTVFFTSREFDLLHYLANNAGKIVTRDSIHMFLYNSEYNGYDRSIDIYVSRIRQKLGDDPLEPRYLKTVRGSGYLFAGSSQRQN